MKLGVIAITSGGHKLADKIATLIPEATILQKEKGQSTASLLRHHWQRFDGFICIMAAGIVVRSIAPLIEDKAKDPCVVVMDEKARYAISLLSGHLGGGNDLALKAAALTGASPVITTASDTLELAPLDLWAQANNLVAPPRTELTKLSAKLVNCGKLYLYADVEVYSLPPGLSLTDNPALSDIIVSHHSFQEKELDCSFFRPKNLIIGSGCNRGTPAEEFEIALQEMFKELQLSTSSIRNLASIDKKNDETGLLQFASTHNWDIAFFTSTELNTLNNLEISFAALKAVGAIGVAEPASLLSAQSTQLISRKRKWKNVTMAIAQAPFTLSALGPDLSNR